jgi:hypothetical protein
MSSARPEGDPQDGVFTDGSATPNPGRGGWAAVYVIGGAIVGTNGGELLGEIGLAIEMGADAEDIALTIHAHPTLHESVGLAAEVFEGSITDLPNAKAKKKK